MIQCYLIKHRIREDYILLSTGWIVFIIILLILTAAIVALYFFGKKAQKRQAEQQEQLAAYAQSMSLLIIDKKRMKLKDAGLPQIVLEQTPKLMRGAKIPIVKAKAGPKIMTFICEESIFDEIPLRKEVKATVSGLYITKVRGLHGKTVVEAPKKKSFMQKLREKAFGK